MQWYIIKMHVNIKPLVIPINVRKLKYSLQQEENGSCRCEQPINYNKYYKINMTFYQSSTNSFQRQTQDLPRTHIGLERFPTFFRFTLSIFDINFKFILEPLFLNSALLRVSPLISWPACLFFPLGYHFRVCFRYL